MSNGRHLFSAAGEKVILRGVNEMFVWSNDKSGIRLLPEIAQTGANCVRLVWTEEEGNKETPGAIDGELHGPSYDRHAGMSFSHGEVGRPGYRCQLLEVTAVN